MKRTIRLRTLTCLGLVAALAACSGRSTSDDPANSGGDGGNAGASPGAGTGGKVGSGGSKPGSGSGGSGPSGGSGGKGGTSGSAGVAGRSGDCAEGETKQASCNTCQCHNGEWLCTRLACGQICGGFAGSTCSSQEYCAYTPGQACGAADASSTCEPRPDACDEIYMPVCGCDQHTYASTCDAAAHGQGVYALGACQAPN